MRASAVPLAAKPVVDLNLDIIYTSNVLFTQTASLKLDFLLKVDQDYISLMVSQLYAQSKKIKQLESPIRPYQQ